MTASQSFTTVDTITGTTVAVPGSEVDHTCSDTWAEAPANATFLSSIGGVQVTPSGAQAGDIICANRTPYKKGENTAKEKFDDIDHPGVIAKVVGSTIFFQSDSW